MSKPFDATLKGMLEWSPTDWPALAGHPATTAEVIDADISTFSGASDKVLRVRGTPDWLLDVNFQSGPDASIPGRAHLYNAMLAARHGLLVRSLVVLLAPQANLTGIDGRYVQGFPGEEPHVVFRYRVVRVWELPVEPLLQGGWSTLPLAPLSAVREADLPAVIERMRRRIRGPSAPPQAGDLWTATWVLMGLRYEQELVERLLRGVIAMEESVTYQAIIRKGRDQGRAEGKAEEARKSLFLVGRQLLGEPAADVTAAIQAIDDVERLEQLVVRALQVKTWDELFDRPRKRARRGRRKS
jgi:predicted transposase YdaD